jgi:phosphatidylserine/phosphatidylglycerophosphate/cardiolipin synthase-like enzyme
MDARAAESCRRQQAGGLLARQGKEGEPMSLETLSIAIVALALLGPSSAARAAEVKLHYAPVENLEHLDLALIRSATRTIDLTAYALTDWAIIAALQDARDTSIGKMIAEPPIMTAKSFRSTSPSSPAASR